MNRIFIILTVLFLSIGISFAQNFFDGVKYYLYGDYDKSSSIFQSFLVKEDSHSPSLYYLAKVSAEGGDLSGAISYLEEALVFDIRDDYLSLLSELQLSNNDYESAMETFNRRYELDSLSSDISLFRALLTYLIGDKDLAYNQINDYEQKYGYDDRLYSAKREYLINRDRYKELLDYSIDVLSVDSENIDKLINTAQLMASFGYDSLALEHYTHAIFIEPNSLEARIAMADYYKLKNQELELIDALHYIFQSSLVKSDYKVEYFRDLIGRLKLNDGHNNNLDSLSKDLINSAPLDSTVIMTYLSYLYYVEDFDMALGFMESEYKSSRLLPSLYITYIQTLYRERDLGCASSLSKELYLLNLSDTELGCLSSYLYQELGVMSMSKRLLNRAIRYAPNDSLKSMAYTMRGDLYSKLFKFKHSFSSYRKAISLDTLNATAYNNYAYFLAEQGKSLDFALSLAQRANMLMPNSATFLDTESWIYYKLGNYKYAKRFILLALAKERSPSYELLLHYADILYALGDDYLAREYWQKSLDSGADKDIIELRLSQPAK